MKNLSSKIDKIGLLVFLLIFFHCIFEIYQIYWFSLSEWSIRDVHWKFYVFFFCGLLMILYSNWSKFAALLLSLLVLIQIYTEFHNVVHNFAHFWYNQTLGFLEIAPFILLMTVVIYSIYSITSNLFIESRKKISFK